VKGYSGQRIDPAKASQIAMFIAAALIGGCLMFMVIVMMITKMQPGWTNAGPLTLIALGLSPVSIVLATALPGILARAFVAKAKSAAVGAAGDKAGRLQIATAAAMNQVIVRSAILEGATFVAAMAVMLEGTWLAVGAFGLLLAAMLAFFPIPARFEAIRDGLLETMK
jgi:hypothetical protein